MLCMAIGKRKVVAIVVPDRRPVVPVVSFDIHREITVFYAVVMFIHEHQGLLRRRCLDVTVFDFGWILRFEHDSFTHFATK